MSNAAELKRTYTMADADLIQKTDGVIDTAIRDLPDLTPRGLSAAKITTLKTARDAFSNFPTDEELQADVSNAVTVKNDARAAVETTVADIRSMADAKYHGKGYYKSFGFEDLSHLSDNKLVRAARRVGRVATTLQPQMTAQGLTTALITTLKTQTDAFDNAIEGVEATVETRDLKTQDRVAAGNAVFAQLMEIANLGQGYYKSRNEAKYNDYVINDTPPPAPNPGGPIRPTPPVI